MGSPVYFHDVEPDDWERTPVSSGLWRVSPALFHQHSLDVQNIGNKISRTI
jgi:hypothetical protein